MRSLVFLSCLVLGASNCLSQSTIHQLHTYSKSELQEDFDIFRGALEELHTGLYWYRSREETDRNLNEILLALTDNMSELDFYNLVAPFVSDIGCGHTRIRLSESLRNSIFSEGKFLPLQLKFLNGKAFCLKNYSSGTSILPGDQIQKINAQPIDSLINQFLEYQIGDGFIQTVKYRALDLDWQYDFAYYHYLLVGESSEYLLDIVNQAGDTVQATINALTKENMNRGMEVNEAEDPANLSLEFIADGHVAILTAKLFYDWSEDSKTFSFQKELREAFELLKAKGTDHLIIDVRNNPGGLDRLGLELISYLSPAPITVFKTIEFKTKKSNYLQYSDRKKLYFRKHEKINDSTFVEIKQSTLQPYGPSDLLFDGNIYLLMNGNCFSTCADFTAQVKSNNIATIIGEEPGGGYYGNTSGSSIPFTLPNTKMTLWVPTNKFTSNVRPIVDFGRGTPPDYSVTPTLSDLINEKDTELNFTLELIKNTKTQD